MKKLTTIFMAVCMVAFMATSVWADGASGSGGFDINARANESVIGGEYDSNDGIMVGSGYISNGESDVWAAGSVGAITVPFIGDITFGSASADINAVGGALGNSENYTFENGYGSISESYGITSGNIDIETDGSGAAGGIMTGNTSQGTGAFSGLENSSGFTGQYASGNFVGVAGGATGIDLDASAMVEVSGNSQSGSYRFGDENTIGTGTYVESETNVDTERSGAACGGWQADGVASTQSSREGASASAYGQYSGSGSLGTNFSGSASGYTETSTTTVQGMDGSVKRASSGMSVSSKVTSD